MAEQTKLVATTRTKLGTIESRRLRKQGIVPGNVYGHGADPISVSAPEDVLNSLIYGHHKVVGVEIDGGEPETALFQEVQWDTFGKQIQHFDLLRISADERITVEVIIEMRGVSPGVTGGGVLNQPLRTLTIECLALDIPESISVRIGELEIGDSIHVKDLTAPEGAIVQNSEDTVVCQVVAAAEEDEEEDGLGDLGPAEPEVIGRDTEDEEASE